MSEETKTRIRLSTGDSFVADDAFGTVELAVYGADAGAARGWLTVSVQGDPVRLRSSAIVALRIVQPAGPAKASPSLVKGL